MAPDLPETESSNKQVVYVAPYHQLPNKKINDFSLNYEYYESEVVESHAPRSGPKEGGTSVQVIGSGFVNTEYLCCKFGKAIIRASFISEERIECVSPSVTDALIFPKGPQSVSLMIANNGIHFRSSGTYIYYSTPAITTMVPSQGPALTKVRLTVTSSLKWAEHLDIMCRFGDALAPANVTWDDKIECLCPVQKNKNPNVVVQMSLNGVDFFGEDLTFRYSNQPLIYSMSTYGPMSGGNEVVVHGKSLDFSAGILCRFGLVETRATWVSATEITCIAPPQNHGKTSFTIISECQKIMLPTDYGNNLLFYTYLSPILIGSIYPRQGVVSGGTLLSMNIGAKMDKLTLTASHFFRLYCVFGRNMTTSAQIEFTDRTVVSCLTPQSHQTGIVSVGLAQDQNFTMLTSSDAQFRYTPVPSIEDIVPGRGPLSGGTVLTLRGNFLPVEFADTESVYCKIGNQTSRASWVSATEIKCITPGENITVREIQTISISPLQGGFKLGFKDAVTDLINATVSPRELRDTLSTLPGLEDISISSSGGSSSFHKSFLVTFLGLEYEHQPLITVDANGIVGDNASVVVERTQALCCDVSVTLNGVDYYRGRSDPLVFVYDEKILLRSLSPSHGSIFGGTDVNLTVTGLSPASHAVNQPHARLIVTFGNNEVVGHWVDEETISCSTPASQEMNVMVGIRIGEVRAESMASFTFRPDPTIVSVFPESLPASGMTTKFIDIYGSDFHGSMICIFDVSAPSRENTDAALRQLGQHKDEVKVEIANRTTLQQHDRVTRQTGRLYNTRHFLSRRAASWVSDKHIRCPQPPTVEPLFSTTDLSWSTNATLVESSMLKLSVETGSDWYFIGAISFQAVAKVTHISPRTGPRAGKTQVMVEGDNFVNSTHLTCKFGSELGPPAQYISSNKVLCISPHFPVGYGRAPVPVQVANNGVDFTVASDAALFEFHEPLVIKEASPLIGLPKGGTVINITLDVTTMRLRAINNKNITVSASMSHMDPPYGPEIGGNVVTIYGSGFQPNQFAGCLFGETEITPAYYISEESIECVAPQYDDITPFINVTLSINGVDVGSQPYTYLPVV